MEQSQEILLNIRDLARAAGISDHKARQLIISEVIKPSRRIKRGKRNMQVMFLQSELAGLVAQIKRHQAAQP